MHVICTDGSVLKCERFEAIDSGVLLFGDSGAREAPANDDEDAEADEEAMAFVPIHQLKYVLPEGMQPRPAGGQAQGRTTQAPPSGASAPPQGGQPQQMGTAQSPPSQPPSGQPPSGQPPSGQDPGRPR